MQNTSLLLRLPLRLKNDIRMLAQRNQRSAVGEIRFALQRHVEESRVAVAKEQKSRQVPAQN
jgi:hypothetical protein